MMMKKILAASAIFAALSLTPPVLAANSGNTAKPANSPNSAAAIACVGAAVNTREAAIDAAVAVHASAARAAYSARASALKAAHTGSDVKAVRAAVKAAWSAFNKAMKDARDVWRASRDKAWSGFRVAVRACKSSTAASLSDSANSSSEASGQ